MNKNKITIKTDSTRISNLKINFKKSSWFEVSTPQTNYLETPNQAGMMLYDNRQRTKL